MEKEKILKESNKKDEEELTDDEIELNKLLDEVQKTAEKDYDDETISRESNLINVSNYLYENEDLNKFLYDEEISTNDDKEVKELKEKVYSMYKLLGESKIINLNNKEKYKGHLNSFYVLINNTSKINYKSIEEVISFCLEIIFKLRECLSINENIKQKMNNINQSKKNKELSYNNLKKEIELKNKEIGELLNKLNKEKDKTISSSKNNNIEKVGLKKDIQDLYFKLNLYENNIKKLTNENKILQEKINNNILNKEKKNLVNKDTQKNQKLQANNNIINKDNILKKLNMDFINLFKEINNIVNLCDNTINIINDNKIAIDNIKNLNHNINLNYLLDNNKMNLFSKDFINNMNILYRKIDGLRNNKVNNKSKILKQTNETNPLFMTARKRFYTKEMRNVQIFDNLFNNEKLNKSIVIKNKPNQSPEVKLHSSKSFVKKDKKNVK